MDTLLLRFVLFCSKILVRQGVDFERLKIIAETKVLMDRRRVYMNWKRRQQKENSNPLLITLFMYAMFGLFVGMLLVAIPSLTLNMIFIHSYILFMMAMTMITDFSSVLLDTTDNQIILPKPVNSKTLFVARLVHILVYLLQFTIALSIFPIGITFFKYGPITGLAMIVTTLLTVAFAVFITYLLYALILRFSNEQKVKDIVGYFQIFMTIFFAVGFQVVPRLVDIKGLGANFELHTYSYFLPPVWMAVTLEAVHNLNFDWIHLVMIGCAFIVPMFTFWIMIKYLAPAFAKKLAALNTDSGATPSQTVSKTQPGNSLSEKISAVICPSKTESAGFQLTWKITGRDKGFKIQFYPGLAYILVFIFIFVFKSGKDMMTLWNDLPNTKMFLFFVYLPIFSIANGLLFITTNENFMASWIYQSTPINQPGSLISGGVKALVVKFFMPVYCIMFAVAVFIWGLPVADDFVLGLFNNLLIILVMSNITDHYLPFSRQPNVKQQSGRFIQTMLQMMIIGILIGLHYLVLQISWLIYCLIPVAAAGCYFLLRRLQQLQWAQISF